MNYIQQAYRGELGMWKYIFFPLFFFGYIGLTFLAVSVLDLDIEKMIQQEIATKGENRFLIESLVPFAIGLGLLFLWVKYIHKQSITSLTTSRSKIDWNRILFSFGLWTVVTVIFVAVGYFLAPEDFVFNFKPIPFLILAIIGIILVPLQTSFEEYFFRGYLMQGLGVVFKNRWVPLFFTSIVFGLMHLGNPEVAKLGNLIMVYYIGTGFFLGILTLMDEGLELALGFHAANNLVTALLVTADWTAFQTNSILIDVSEPTLGADVYIPVFIVFPLLLFFFSKKYGWTNWKERLFGKIEKPTIIED